MFLYDGWKEKKIALKHKNEMGSLKKKGNQCDFLSHLITSQPPQ
ncbi:hypothetical protein BSBH6_02847 [Bacillus subtilis]|nr:hypothetical protein BSBH6_02847 [Bacillus subtilis]RPK23813.1 hypothetical protein BH5_02844 [Bacillus subtilis]